MSREVTGTEEPHLDSTPTSTRYLGSHQALLVGAGLTACSGTPTDSSAPVESPTEDAGASDETTSTAPDEAAGTIVRFTAGDVVVEAVIVEENPTTRSFIAMLPMTLTFSDFGGKEKVASLTGDFDYTDAEGLNPRAGDLFSYMPWGNIGTFYKTEGNTSSNSLTKIGETDDIHQIELLDGQ
ncbi:hypothetical protein FHU29_002524 [Hoyosella altamirensis]|uniref:Cyclophilin-like domain-containing protein n=2 Tax=Hoyosella altamirensis TaxID=616997 RepID=A0A839RMW6_9ACTN|nr:cyclophilin-like fold protein [Hoyosella altamirensis]MBB3038075.1 hypothetical protein [Hoyosella altamirensis]